MIDRLLDLNTVHVRREGDTLTLSCAGVDEAINQIVRCFPFTSPDQWISFRRSDGTEMGLVKSIAKLDPASRAIVAKHLHDRYYIPSISRIDGIENRANGTEWRVETADGPQTLFLRGERGVNTSEFPKILLTDATTHQRFVIASFTALDRPSQKLARANGGLGARGGRGGGRHFH
ncbi:MAG: DUF1854 domain-containing protein [bacterium]|nr:DUF1854 domain-containing protein [bacterium]